MKQRLMRPTAALFPIVGIISVLWGDAAYTVGVFLVYYLLTICTLCAADCFRNGAAQEPGVRRVDQRFGGTLLPLLAGIVLVWIWGEWRVAVNLDFDAIEIVPWYGLFPTAVAIIVEQTFEERMFALGRRMDGVILSCVANGLLLAGLLLTGGSGLPQPITGFYTVIGAALGAVIAAATCYAIEPPHGFSMKPRNLKFAPRACAQTILYPVLMFIALGLVAIYSENNAYEDVRFGAAACFGLIPWRLARTTCRRTADESRPLNLLLITFVAIPAAIAAWLPAAQLFAIASGIALLCAALVFCAPSARLYAGIALTAATFIPFPTPIINTALALAAILINTKQAFLRKV